MRWRAARIDGSRWRTRDGGVGFVDQVCQQKHIVIAAGRSR
jgi:hypothetical protein